MLPELNNDYPYLKECRENWRKTTYRAWWFARAYFEVFRKIDIAKGSRMLSIGSGMGQLEHFLDKRFSYEVICLDINPYALQTGTNLFGNNRSVAANAISLPFPDNSMDFVLSYDFMEHLSDESVAHVAFSEMERVVKNAEGIQMLHKITVTEEQEAIDADKTHYIKWSADKWRQWFEGRGWGIQEPTCHRIPIWSRKKIGLYPVEGAFYLAKIF